MQSDESWDEAYVSGRFREHWEYRAPSQELVAVVAAGIVPPGGTTLDVGCGTGVEATFLAQSGFRSIGVDVSSAGLELARQRAREAGVDVEWHLAAASAMPLEDASVDFANDRGCLHAIEPEDREAYAHELHRVLKPGACTLIRGCRLESNAEGFVAITETAIDTHLVPAGFERGPVLPILLISDGGSLDANVVVLRRV
jgi:ubiquinone/menaquinone biosynthesis C-methylase UbiE